MNKSGTLLIIDHNVSYKRMLTFVSKEYWLDVHCLHGPAPASPHGGHAPAHLVSALATPMILHSLVHTQEQASSLRSCGDGASLGDVWDGQGGGVGGKDRFSWCNPVVLSEIQNSVQL